MVYRFGDFQLDPQLRQLRHAGQVVDSVQPKVFDVLLYLLEHRDRVVTKDELIQACWPEEFVSDNALHRCVKEVRKQLGDEDQHQIIKTVSRRGYVFSTEVQYREDFSSQDGTGHAQTSDQVLEPEALLDQLASMMAHARMPGLIDAPAYLRMLRREVDRLEGDEENRHIVAWLKGQIKNFCITCEIYFTHQTSERLEGGHFLYACSGLLDHGPTTYLQDTGWLTLLRSMSQAQRRHEGHFLRVFFLEFGPLSRTDFMSIGEVIQRHLRHGVDVALMDQSAIPPDVRVKRNMAWLNGSLVMLATDQIQWDLEITHHQTAISSAREKHDFFVKHAVYTFSHDVSEPIMPILADLYPEHKDSIWTPKSEIGQKLVRKPGSLFKPT